MRNYVAILFLIGFSFSALSKNIPFEYKGRHNAIIKREQLEQAKSIFDLYPGIWQHLALPEWDRKQLDSLRRRHYALGYDLFPERGYERIIDLVSVEISTGYGGVTTFSTGLDERLTTDQLKLLRNIALGSEIRIAVKFRYKNLVGSTHKIIEGFSLITFVPETEAEFPGGFTSMSRYLSNTLFTKIGNKGVREIQQAVVSFTVNEHGSITQVKVSGTSLSINITQTILEALSHMPKWKPARNENGQQVPQVFSVALGSGNC